jgi:transcription elongation factor GreB
MSKAFLKESDLSDEPDLAPRPVLPVGAKNYITPEGARALRAKLEHLLNHLRPSLVAGGSDPEKKAELQRLDRQIRGVEQSLRTAEIAFPPEIPDDRIRFGATVTLREPEGSLATYRIVGVDEMDLERNWISWISPLAGALLGSNKGGRVSFRTPAGLRELEVLDVAYQ